MDSSNDLKATSWAMHNPDCPIQPPCIHSTKFALQSDMSIGTYNILKKKNTGASLETVQVAVAKYLKEQNAFINTLAQQHLVDKKHIKNMINHVSNYALTQCLLLANMILHFKSKEINSSRSSLLYSVA